MNRVILSPGYFNDPLIGRPVSLGYLYIGKPDLDPEIVANQKQVSAQQESGAIVPITQPVRTNQGGSPVYNGSTVTVLVSGDYSLTVLRSDLSQANHVPNTMASSLPTFVSTIADLKAVTVQSDGDEIYVLGFATDSDGGQGHFKFDSSNLLTPVTDDPNEGTYAAPDSAPTGASGAWVRLDAEPETSSFDFWKDVSTGPAKFTRLKHRLFMGDGARNAGTVDKTDGTGFVGDPADVINAFYLERSAMVSLLSPNGGVGVLGGSKKSDRYAQFGATVWLATTAVTSGDKRGYVGKYYTADSTGITGSTPPTHTAGSVSDGSINWTFVDFVYTAPIGSASAIISDVADGEGAWGTLIEAVRGTDGGTTYAREVSVKNKGADVLNTPYDIFPAGSTIGDWFPAGGDAAFGAPANPNTCGILFGKSAETWNKGIVFGAESITGSDGTTGTGTAIAFGKGHELTWSAADGETARIRSDITTINSRTSLVFSDNTITHGAGTGVIGTFEAGVANPENYVRLFGTASGTPSELRAGSVVDANVDLLLSTKGTGKLAVSYAIPAAVTPVNFSADRVLEIKQGGVSFYIPAMLASW